MSVDLVLFPLDTIKTRIQVRENNRINSNYIFILSLLFIKINYLRRVLKKRKSII